MGIAEEDRYENRLGRCDPKEKEQRCCAKRRCRATCAPVIAMADAGSKTTKLSEEELLKKIEETQRSAEEIVKRFVDEHNSVSGDVKIENLNLSWLIILVL